MSTVEVPYRIHLAAIPDGLPDAGTWRVSHDAAPDPQEGEVQLAVRYLSVDPAMATWVQPLRSYSPPVKVGEVMRAFGVAEVAASRDKHFQAGDVVFGIPGVQTHVTIPAKSLRKLDPAFAPLPKYLGGLGMTGFTAYFGLTDIGRPVKGNTVVVSAAAGAVGSVVCQVAKLMDTWVIGIAGGPEKCRYLIDELGIDAAIDYKNEKVQAALDRFAPDGIDVYFDNVGGQTLEAVLARINRHARVVVCGGISQYQHLSQARGPRNHLQLVAQSATMQGFTMLDYLPRIPEAATTLGGWMQQGKLRTREHIVKGIEHFSQALSMLFSGANHGKLIIEI